MKKGFFSAAAVLLLACCTLGGCAEDGAQNTPPDIQTPPSEEKNLLMEENSVVKSVTEIGSVTGSKSPWNDTVTGAGVGGTDLGIPVYDSKNERMLIFYGDTFSGQNKGEGSGYNDWRSNVCAYSTDFDLSDGLTLDGWITREGREQAKQIIPSMKTDGVEITTIPTGSVEIDGNIYLFYMSVRKWGGNGEWWVNYCGLTKSTDGGENYTQVEDVYFVGQKDQITVSVTGKTSAEVKAHYAPNFCQVWPMLSGEYVYFYGIEGGRMGSVQLARVKASEIESFGKYEYYTGMNADGDPVFLQGEAGLKAVTAEDNEKTYVMEGPAGEMCVIWNAYLNKYITIYQRGTVMVFRSAENPWGEWSKPISLVGYDTYNAMYCGFMNEKYTEQNGKIVYFMMSYWWDYESILMKLELY